jgi:hypothetical protein
MVVSSAARFLLDTGGFLAAQVGVLQRLADAVGAVAGDAATKQVYGSSRITGG